MYRALAERYPYAHCELDFENPLQLLVATVLSAQTTDVMVNKVTVVYTDPSDRALRGSTIGLYTSLGYVPAPPKPKSTPKTTTPTPTPKATKTKPPKPKATPTP